jgi:hypothetical protein
MSKTLPGNYAVGIGGMRYFTTLAGTLTAITFFEGANQQGGIRINAAGTITVLGAGGAVIATSTAAITANSTHYIEWNITFSATGAYNIYLDGVSIMSGTGNFKTSTNAYYNIFNYLFGSPSASFTTTMDDLYIDDGTGAPLLTNPVVETHFPTSDASPLTFTVGNAIIGAWSTTSNGVTSPGANRLALRPVVPSVSGTLTSVSILPAATSVAANFKVAVYSDVSGTPTTLLGTGPQVTGAVLNTALTLPLTTGLAITAGTTYWLGFITDTSVSLNETDTGTLCRVGTVTYTSGAPTTAPTTTAAQPNMCTWGTVTGVTLHTYEVDQSPSPATLGDFSYVQSSTVGNEDLFNTSAMSTNPSQIYSVAVKAFLRDSDAGLRTITIQAKSGSVDSSGPAIAPSQTNTWVENYYLVDPNTSALWTVAAVNAATVGVKVAS